MTAYVGKLNWAVAAKALKPNLKHRERTGYEDCPE